MRKENDNSKRNLIVAVLSVIAIIVVVTTTTYAWWQWSTTAEEQTNVSITMSDMGGQQIVIPEGEIGSAGSISNATLYPVTLKTSGVSRTFSLDKNDALAATTLTATMKLKLATFPAAFADSKIRWELTENGTSIGSGNFAGKAQGETITLGTSTVTTTPKSYVFYLWMDGTQGENSSATQNLAYSVELTVDVTSS